MKITINRSNLAKPAGDLLIVVATKEQVLSFKNKPSKNNNKTPVDFSCKEVVSTLGLYKDFELQEFEGKEGQTIHFSSKEIGIPHLVFIGWQSQKDLFSQIDAYRKFGSIIFSTAKKYGAKNVILSLDKLSLKNSSHLTAFIEGIELTNYSYDKYKSSEKGSKKNYSGIDNLILLTKETLQINLHNDVKAITDATLLARDLINLSPRDCTPSHLVKVAREVARDTKLAVRVYDKDDLAKMGANLLLSVAQGSDEPPYLINLNYKPKKPSSKIVALVGKGITFDSGGLSIKSGTGMEDMKMDMSGAAAVIAAMKAIAILKPSVEVRAYIPTTENMINGKATRPGDVIKGLSGKTVEILNTDAEGRLILADALHLAEKEGAKIIVDIATLTGAIVVALGSGCAGLFSNNDRLAQQLTTAADQSGEKIWRMPLVDEYKQYIKSRVADIKNIGNASKGGGSITAALFLNEFIDKAAWAHLDIAAVAFQDSDKYCNKAGGVGFGVRTLVKLVRSL